jgi:SNF2 family DNA or RNA helicase
VVDEFQNDEECRVIVMTTAGGMGINLTAASAVIFYDLLWNPKMMDQIIARAVRFGNTAEKVEVINIISTNSVEEKILEQAAEKSRLFDVIMQGSDPSTIEIEDNVFSSLLDLLKEK